MLNYTRIIGIDNCSFHGVRRDRQTEWGCGRLWPQYKRDQLIDALERATEKVEEYLGYPLSKKYFVQQLDYNSKTYLTTNARWKELIETGAMTTEDIQLGAALTLSDITGPIDPIIIVVPTTATDTAEIHVYHTEVNGAGEIETLSISISGGNATIRIPRCHLVIPDSYQPEDGYVYEEDAWFVSEVDVKRIYTDLTTGQSLIYRSCGSCSGCETGLPCELPTQEACAIIKDSETGHFWVRPATYGTAWTVGQFLSGRTPYAAQVSYAAGRLTRMPSLESAIFRLAHTEMPQPICSCSVHNESWTMDRTEPKQLSWTILTNPFGTLRGQIYAWNTIQLFLMGQGGVI